jgi:hypothetical protein
VNSLRIRQRINVDPSQVGVIVGLQPMLDASGLILICPRCQAEGGSHIAGNADVTLPTWSLTCDCTERILERRHAARAFDATGDLIASADTVLQPLRLAVRCPEFRCVTHPLTIERGPAGVSVRCHCANTTFRTPTPTIN